MQEIKKKFKLKQAFPGTEPVGTVVNEHKENGWVEYRWATNGKRLEFDPEGHPEYFTNIENPLGVDYVGKEVFIGDILHRVEEVRGVVYDQRTMNDVKDAGHLRKQGVISFVSIDDAVEYMFNIKKLFTVKDVEKIIKGELLLGAVAAEYKAKIKLDNFGRA